VPVVELFEGELLPPQAATATLDASTARTVSMAFSGVLFMVGGALLVTRLLGAPAYQPYLRGH
jgi:ABC-type uncharacterized transport system permease subunit